MRGDGRPHARTTRTRAGSVAALTLVVLLSGCAVNRTERSCGGVGLKPNGVDVHITKVAHLAGDVVTVCTPHACTSVTRGPADESPTTYVSNPGIDSTRTVPVSITVRDASGKIVVPTARLIVTPIKEQPNGPSCGTGYFATAVVPATG